MVYGRKHGILVLFQVFRKADGSQSLSWKIEAFFHEIDHEGLFFGINRRQRNLIFDHQQTGDDYEKDWDNLQQWIAHSQLIER